MSNIKCVRLVTGEDVIADVSTNIADTITLENPVQVGMVHSRSSSGEPNFGFSPFPLVSNDKKIDIKESCVMFICEPAEEFKNQYNAIFGSGIVTPSKSIIV